MKVLEERRILRTFEWRVNMIRFLFIFILFSFILILT